MTDEQKAAYIQSQSACALIEMHAMAAENSEREQQGLAQAYDGEAFMEVIERYGIHHNAVMETFSG